VLRDYAGLLASVKRGVLLTRRVGYEYKYSDYSFNVSDTEFYLKAPAGEPDSILNPRLWEPARPRAVRLVNPITIELEDGYYTRVLVTYAYPSGLPEGLLYFLDTEVSEVTLIFSEVIRPGSLGWFRRLGGGGSRAPARAWRRPVSLSSLWLKGSSALPCPWSARHREGVATELLY